MVRGHTRPLEMVRFDYGVCIFSLMFLQILAVCVYDLNFVNFVYLCEIAIVLQLSDIFTESDDRTP